MEATVNAQTGMLVTIACVNQPRAGGSTEKKSGRGNHPRKLFKHFPDSKVLPESRQIQSPGVQRYYRPRKTGRGQDAQVLAVAFETQSSGHPRQTMCADQERPRGIRQTKHESLSPIVYWGLDYSENRRLQPKRRGGGKTVGTLREKRGPVTARTKGEKVQEPRLR